MNYQESISRLEEASVFGIKPGLERMQKILAVLGNPEKACKMIHITGTNGKGSVAAMITSVLENTNLRVGRFTSPHLIDYTERIYLGGKDISREDFAKAATVVFKAHDELVAAGEEALTEFELLTAIAFWYFRENKADYAVMEVGMGGRIAEELIFDDVTTGASQDIKQVTDTARSMITKFGMSDRLGFINYEENTDEVFLGRDLGHSRSFSEEVASIIDKEVKKLVDDCYTDAKRILTENMDVLHSCANLLLEKERISREEFEALFKNDKAAEENL